ncbi:hypothetical protein [Chelativorans sp. M5D2P16]|nr:hypothetical protein [Chelativorans sp. M5D2P16]MDZ5699614.1 hypothetical protein [Chelativorans sp. M5D2P16]
MPQTACATTATTFSPGIPEPAQKVRFFAIGSPMAWHDDDA